MTLLEEHIWNKTYKKGWYHSQNGIKRESQKRVEFSVSHGRDMRQYLQQVIAEVKKLASRMEAIRSTGCVPECRSLPEYGTTGDDEH